jgi:hypothetical protein
MGPSSEAVEAAAIVWMGGRDEWDSMTNDDHEYVRQEVRPMLAAALPIIRREIAEEIEADFRDNVNTEALTDNGERVLNARAWGMYRAAEIARGEVSR